MATLMHIVHLLVQQNHQMQRMQQAMQAIGEAVKAAQAGNNGSDSGNRGVNDKVMRGLGKFDGQNWKECSHHFKTTLKRASRKGDYLFEKPESQPHQVDFDDIEFDDEIEYADAHKWATDIYDALSLVLKGDAFAIAQGAPEMNGVKSWRRV